jgi:hypothetical protein
MQYFYCGSVGDRYEDETEEYVTDPDEIGGWEYWADALEYDDIEVPEEEVIYPPYEDPANAPDPRSPLGLPLSIFRDPPP